MREDLYNKLKDIKGDKESFSDLIEKLIGFRLKLK